MKISDPNEKAKLYPLAQLIKDIWHFSGKRKKHLVIGTIIRIIGDVVGLYPAYAIGALVTSLTEKTYTLHSIYTMIALWVSALLIRTIFHYQAKKMVFYTGYEVSFTVEKKMLGVLISKDSAWHEQDSSGAKFKRIERGADGYNNILRAWIANYLSVIIRFFGIPVILFQFDKTVSVLVVIFMVVYFIVSKYLQSRCIQAANKFNAVEDTLRGIEYEAVSNIRTIRFLNVGQELLEKVQGHMKSLLKAVVFRMRAFQGRGHIMKSFGEISRVGIISFITIGVIYGRYDIGFIVLFSSYFSDILTNIQELTDVSQDTIVSSQSISRMYDLTGKEAQSENYTENFPQEWDMLKVENLSFSYGTNQALQDISFTVKNGEKVGIVGLSGAGKSTLFKLLIRERTDYQGDIKIGNINIQDIRANDFYEHISIVPQDTEVFNFSLKDNITIAQSKKENDNNLLEKSLEVSHVKDFLLKLPEGVDTKIGERGVKLSGGERQRLGIARAIFKEPSILLLDEATSHLDLESEEKIKDSLHKFFENVTAIVIAHRLTTIKEMDKILVIEEGGIIEEGSYDELMEKKGRFYELWQKQLF